MSTTPQPSVQQRVIDVVARAVKTFYQTFIAALVVPVSVYNGAQWKAAALAAAAAGISAVTNAAKHAADAATPAT